jgi:hypothetical protein
MIFTAIIAFPIGYWGGYMDKEIEKKKRRKKVLKKS